VTSGTDDSPPALLASNRGQHAFLTPVAEPTATWVIGVGAVAVVAVFGFLVARTSSFTADEIHLSAVLNAWHTGAIGAIASGVYAVFSPVPAIVITILVAAAILLRSRDLRLAITFGIVIAATWIPSALVKAAVARPRPDAAMLPHPFAVQPADASYPSGHLVFVTALVVTLILLTRGHRLRPLVTVLGVALVALVGASLVIDGVHYASDALASILWSIGVAPFILEAWNRFVLPRSYRGDRAARPSSLG
jgi:membrane-associated phospholipid phosphatase